MRRIAWTAIFLCLVLFTLSVPPTHAAQKWTVDDILLAESASQFAISPDGTMVVWVRSKMDKDKGTRISNLWLSRLNDGTRFALTRGKHSHFRPRWSPDGKIISFLSDRPRPDGKKKDAARTQLWFMRVDGGEPWPVTDFKRPVRDYAWKDDHTLVFIAQEDPTLYEQEVKKKKDTSRVVEDEAHEPPVRIFLFDIKTKKVTRVTTNDDWIQMLAVSPDGRWAVTRHGRSLRYVYDQEIPPVTYLTNLDTGVSRRLFKDQPRWVVRSVHWTPDSQAFYFVVPYTHHPKYLEATINRLYYYVLDRDTYREVDLGWPNGLAFGGIQVTPDGFLALLADGLRFRPAHYVKRGDTWRRSWVKGEHARNIFGWVVARDGQTLVYNHSTAMKPTQWYRARLQKNRLTQVKAITDLNPAFRDKPIPRVEILHWTGARGDTVDGLLYYPLDYQAGRRYPLVLMIHGGPTGVDLDAWSLSWARPIPLLAQKGAFVLRVNYHGSGNYGLEWAESICCGKYYELEVPDLETGVDHVIQMGLADPQRLATMGWSNGAILSTALVTHTNRYKAAAVGAGDVEWISDWANVDFGASFDNYYFGASPLENPMLYIRKSPYFRLPKVTTPTIIFTGTEDRNVPPSQSWSHYRALQQTTKTPVRFILFPGEPHGLRKYVHQRRKVEEELAWFDRYLFENPPHHNEALKRGSPLDLALKQAQFARYRGHYGKNQDGVLIPESVTYQGLIVTRFEITRAQYAAFDPNYPYPPGTEDYPANGITYSQARAYCAWLAQKTGTPFRLPTEKEGQKLYDSGSAHENTLDYWAGYAVNPDDAERLAEVIRQLPGAAPLLKEVGLFQPRGEDPVFDLGGNVAEWVTGADGAGKTMGGSADQPADAKWKERDPAPAYRGFRCVASKSH